jgi:hypothetical protein
VSIFVEIANKMVKIRPNYRKSIIKYGSNIVSIRTVYGPKIFGPAQNFSVLKFSAGMTGPRTALLMEIRLAENGEFIISFS